MKKLIALVVLCIIGFVFGFVSDAQAETVHLHVEVDATHSRCSLLTWGEHGRIETRIGQALDVTFNVATNTPPLGIQMRCGGRLLKWSPLTTARLSGFRSITVNGVEMVWHQMAAATVSVAETTWLIAIPTEATLSATTTAVAKTLRDPLTYSWVANTIPHHNN
jgi:hypothetical protein